MCTDAPPNPSSPWHVGLVGFAYPEWAGPFYPSGLSDRDRFHYYTTRFNAVEINTTFYGPPAPSIVTRWAQTAPAGFRFCLKAPRDVTHGPTPEGSLANAQGPDAGHFDRPDTLTFLLRLFDTAVLLGDKLGPVLMQFPPAFTDRDRAGLARFLDCAAPAFAQLQAAAPNARLALEFRHDAWFTPATQAMLAERGMILVAADHAPRGEAAQTPAAPRAAFPLYPPTATADTLYLRFLGKHGQFRDRTREHLDPTPRLAWWTHQATRLLQAEPVIRDVYAFFDNDFAGHAPATAQRFRGLIGLPACAPVVQMPRSGPEPTLFDA